MLIKRMKTSTPEGRDRSAIGRGEAEVEHTHTHTHTHTRKREGGGRGGWHTTFTLPFSSKTHIHYWLGLG